MSNIIFGKPISDTLTEMLKVEFSKISNLEFLKIVIIQIGDDPGSTKYVELKTKKALSFGITLVHLKFDDEVEYSLLQKQIEELNLDPNVQGIMIQSPVAKLDLESLANLIIPEKDFDGMGKDAIVLPAVDVAIDKILDYVYDNFDLLRTESKTNSNSIISGKFLSAKRVCIINDSIILGKPLAKYLKNFYFTVDMCNKFTPDISAFTKEADILITGTGIPGLIKGEMVKQGGVVIDCGFPLGDCVFDEVSEVAGAITPVPGGVGPLTVTCLFYNLLQLMSPKK